MGVLALGLLQTMASISIAHAATLSWSDITGTTFHTNDWNQIRTNSDGTVVGVISSGSRLAYLGDFYLSRDSGASWTYSSSDSNLRALAVSGDGTRAISGHDAKIYRTFFSGGSYTYSSYTWSNGGTGANQRCGGNYGPNFNSFAASSDGVSWIAGVRDESCIYTSSDSGSSWYGTAVGSTNWGSAISADGTIKITANSDGHLYKKSGSGSWAAITSASLPSSTGWWAVVCDSTCTNMTAIQNGTGYLYSTSDSGSTWTHNSLSRDYSDISMSSDGTKVAATDGSDLYISVDSGANWVSQNQSGKIWQSVTISGDGKKIYAAASDGTIRKSAFLATQSALSISPVTGIFGTDLTLATTGGSGTGSVSYTYSAGTTTCSLTGNVLSATGAGTCLITATKAADTTYSAISSSQTTITFGKGAQPTALIISSTSGTFGTALSLTTTGGNGSGTNTFVIDSGPCTVSGSTLNSSGAGTCMVTATKASDTNYLATSSSSTSIIIARQVPTFTWPDISKVYGDSFTISAPSPSTPGTFTYTSANTSVVTLNSETATVVGVGTSIITASFIPTDTSNYRSGETATMTVTAARATLYIAPTAGQSKVYGTSDPTITYSITSGALVGSDQLFGALTYASAGQNTAVGSYSITSGTLTNANNPNYSITLTAVNFAITRATQAAVSLSSLSSSYNPSNKTAALTGSGGSGTGSYAYEVDISNTTPGCAVSGSTLTYTTAGTCVISVTRSSDTNYLARRDVVSFSVGLASQTINFASLSAKSYSNDTFTVTATSSSSLTVVFTSSSPLVCTTSGTNGSVISLLGVGTCVINANQIGDLNTSAASQVSQNFTVSPRAITLTADAKTKIYGETDPTLTYAITSGSLLLGDALTGSLTRTMGTDAGSYPIQQGTLTLSSNPKYAITYNAANLTISRATPTLALTYPNSNVAILRPGATDTPTVTTSSSAGTLTYASSAPSSICTVNSSSGVISLFGAGTCAIAMTTAQTTNYIQYTETATVTVVLLSSSLTGIDQSKLVSMGQPFYAHPSLDQSYSFSSGNYGASVAIPAGSLDASIPISINLLTDSTDQRAVISSDGTSVLSVVVSWVAADGSVPSTNTGKSISITLTNPAIKSGAKIYSVIGNQSQLLGTSTVDGSITTFITDDPVLVVINPVVTTPAPSAGGGGYDMAVAIDNASAIEAANLKLAAEKAAAEKAAQDAAAKVAADQLNAEAALKAAQEKMAADAKTLADAKAAQDATALKAAQDAAEASARAAAVLQAAKDVAVAAAKAAASIKPAVTLYSLSAKLTLNAYDSAYLQKYANSLKTGSSVTCVGYVYRKNTTLVKATTLAKSQANAVCTLMRKNNKSLKTSVRLLDSSQAPKAARGAKWVAVSYRIDGFKAH